MLAANVYQNIGSLSGEGEELGQDVSKLELKPSWSSTTDKEGPVILHSAHCPCSSTPRGLLGIFLPCNPERFVAPQPTTSMMRPKESLKGPTLSITARVFLLTTLWPINLSLAWSVWSVWSGTNQGLFVLYFFRNIKIVIYWLVICDFFFHGFSSFISKNQA